MSGGTGVVELPETFWVQARKRLKDRKFEAQVEKSTSINSNPEIYKEKEMADFRRWILALAVVALLAGFTVPASAQPVTCSTSVTVTPIVRSQGLAELVGDLVLYCTGGTPTLAGNPVPAVNITVFLNTNITSKVLGTQLAAYGNGQTSGLDEALLIIDEPNSPNSPGITCAQGGTFFNPATADICLGLKAGFDPGVTGTFGNTAVPYPILNCGAVVGSNLAAPDGGPSGPGVCQIYATPYPEHTYDGTIAGSPANAGAGVVGDFGPCTVGANITVPNGTSVAGQSVISFPIGTVLLNGIPATAANSYVGDIVTGTGISANTVVTKVGVGSATVAPTLTISIPAGQSITQTITLTPPGGVTSPGTVGAPGYGCGRPNVFQGRVGFLQNPNQYNAVTFLGVPFDPPGTTFGRTLRITNIRANANQLGVSSTFTTQQILMNIAINGPTTLTIANPQQIVGYVNTGMTVGISPGVGTTAYGGFNTSVFNQSGTAIYLPGGGLRTGIAPNVPVISEFVQCISENGDLYSGTPAPGFLIPNYLGIGGFDCGPTAVIGNNGDCSGASPTNDATPWVRFTEGFASSWKTKNLSHIVGDGTGSSTSAGNATLGTAAAPTVKQGPNSFNCLGDYCYNGNRNNQLDIPQNVPGAVYNTESGFTYQAVGASSGPPGGPGPNPPPGLGYGYTVPTQGNPLSDDWALTANATNISGAGVANQGTRLYLSFTNIPNGTSLWVSPVIYLFRQGVQHNGDPASLTAPGGYVTQSQATGVMVLTSTDGAGNGAFAQTASILTPFQLQKVGSTGLAVYEILYTDPFSPEYADVPVVLAYASNPGQNLPAPAPPNPNTQVTGGFAPFYTSAAAQQPSPNATFQAPTLPVPRFVPGTAFDFINIQKCTCNVLFPFVANALGYDTGIAFANTSLDPGATYGFGIAQPQAGTVQFWYYGDMTGGAAVPGPQTSSAVQPGHVLTYVLSSGSSQYGLDARGAGLTGYMIAQSQFQYCHAYAFISAQGAGPTSPGTSEGYLGLIFSDGGLGRTTSPAETLTH